MPAYRLNRGLRFGEIINLPQSQEIHLAALLGDIIAVAEEVVQVPKEPEWGVGTTDGGHACINLRTVNGELLRFDGQPDQAADGFKIRVWSGEKQDYVFDGPVPPVEIVAEYKARYEPRTYSNGGAMEAYFRARKA